MRTSGHVFPRDKRNLVHRVSGSKLEIFQATNLGDVDRVCGAALYRRGPQCPVVLFEMGGVTRRVGDEIGMIATARGHEVHRMEFPRDDLFTHAEART